MEFLMIPLISYNVEHMDRAWNMIDGGGGVILQGFAFIKGIKKWTQLWRIFHLPFRSKLPIIEFSCRNPWLRESNWR